MRQGQQHRRGGGRGRKPQNPLARNYESNGPEVKIRGTAAQIAEKYLSLARDALASGDMVAAESYFQHAEHYNRIIMATQSQMSVPNSHQSEGHNASGGFRPRWNADVSDRFGNRPGEGTQVVVMALKSVIAGTAVEICRASGASRAVPREVTGTRA